MLQPKTVAAQDVVTIRLTTGDEIVGRFIGEDSTTITLSKPITIQLHMVAPGQAAIAFGPFMASLDDSGQFSIYKSALVVPPQKTREDVKKKYIEATSGLTLPPSQGASTLLKP